MEELGTCPICKKPLVKWYSGYGGENYIGCKSLTCGYKKEK